MVWVYLYPPPQRLQEEAQWMLVVEYVRALMHKRTVCRSAGERLQLAQRIAQDDLQLRELFTGLVGGRSHSGSSSSLYLYTKHQVCTAVGRMSNHDGDNTWHNNLISLIYKNILLFCTSDCLGTPQMVWKINSALLKG